MRKFFSVLASLAIAAGLLVGSPAVPAHASGGGTQAGTFVYDQGYNFDAVESTLVMTTASTGACGTYTNQDRSHWIGIQNAAGTELVQAGYTYRDIQGTYTTTWWYEFWNGTNPAHNVTLSYTPSVGDDVYIHLWYHDQNSWGLVFEDMTTSTMMFDSYIYTSVDSGGTNTAANYLNPYADIITERSPTYDLEYGNQETFKYSEYHTRGIWYYYRSNSWSNTFNMLDSGGTAYETATYPDTAQYAYHTWNSCS